MKLSSQSNNKLRGIRNFGITMVKQIIHIIYDGLITSVNFVINYLCVVLYRSVTTKLLFIFKSSLTFLFCKLELKNIVPNFRILARSRSRREQDWIGYQ